MANNAISTLGALTVVADDGTVCSIAAKVLSDSPASAVPHSSTAKNVINFRS